MQGVAELAFGVAALVYAVGLALFRLPLLPVRRWGWTLMMHSWSGVAVVAVLGSLAVVKALFANYLTGIGFELPLMATFDDAVASAEASRDMALSWLGSLSFAAVTLGAIMGLMNLAMAVLSVTGVGLILWAIASYLISSIFALIGFMAKILSGVVLFMEGVVAFVGLSRIVAPALFMIGVVAYVLPFARTLGKTLMVLGAALTIGLPVAIVAASPPPGYADQSIQQSAEVQALSIAGRAVVDLERGVRYTVYDRENDSLWHPLLLAEPLSIPEIDREKACANLPRRSNITCDQLIEMIKEIIGTTPVNTIFDTGGGGYYDAYTEGYRLAIINNTYARKVWFLNMWITLYDKNPKRIDGEKIPEEPRPEDRACVDTTAPGYDAAYCPHPYLLWKQRWEEFWQAAPLYNETSMWMVSANRNSTFVWFTEQPWGTPREELNRYGITLPKVRELRWQVNETYTCELDGNASTVETCWRWHYFTQGDYCGNNSVYFVYLNMEDKQVCWTVRPIYGGPVGGTKVCDSRPGTPSWSYRFTPLASGPTWGHRLMNSSFQEILEAGFIDGYGPYELPQSVQAVDRNQPLVLSAPTREMKVFVTANQTIIQSSYEGYPEVPEKLDYSFRVDFSASESMPYLPEVDWWKFDEDEQHFINLAYGAYAPDTIAGVSVETLREEWARYRNFRQGLYRDGPSHEAARRITQKLLEYRESNWRTNETLFGTNIPLAKAVTDIIQKHVYGQYAGSDIRVDTQPLLVTSGGSVAVLKPVSELIGQSFAIGIAVGFLAVAIDSIQALVGGQSVMMKYMFSKVGNISHSMRFFSSFVHAVHRMSKIDVMTRALSRRRLDQMLKTLLEARKQDRNTWERMVERKFKVSELMKKEELNPEEVLLVKSVLRNEKMLDRLEELQNEKGVSAWIQRQWLGTSTRNYQKEMLHQYLRSKETAEKLTIMHADRLAKGVKPEEALAQAEEMVRYVKQSKPVNMPPDKFFDGAAAMMRNASSTERLAMVDSLSRADLGRKLVNSGFREAAGHVFEAVGHRVSVHFPAAGATLSHVGAHLKSGFTAPAAFSLAADAQQPYTAEGVRPVIGYAAGPYPADSIRHGSAVNPTADIPVVREEFFGGDFSDVKKAVDVAEKYGSPSDVEKIYVSLDNYMEAVKPYDEGFKLSDFMEKDTDNKVVFSVDYGVSAAAQDRFTVEYETSVSTADRFAEWVEPQGGKTVSVHAEEYYVKNSIGPDDVQGHYTPEWFEKATRFVEEASTGSGHVENSSTWGWDFQETGRKDHEWFRGTDSKDNFSNHGWEEPNKEDLGGRSGSESVESGWWMESGNRKRGGENV